MQVLFIFMFQPNPNEYFSAFCHKLTIRYTKWGKNYEGCRF